MDLSHHSDAFWDIFIGECIRLKAPLYRRLTEGVRDDAELRAMAAQAKPGQPMANMLFAAVHYLLLRGAQHPLRSHYATLGPVEAFGDPFPLFRDFCLSHGEEISALIVSRVTNTNEVGRSALLYAGFSVLASRAEAPLHLIEIGPSAGLNMFWDLYAYRFFQDGVALRAGGEDATPVIDMEVSGGMPPLGPPPDIGVRLGLERDPVDLSLETDRDWLRALIWPDHPGRFRRLEAALAATRNVHPDIRKGDALDLIGGAMANMPRSGTLCGFHTMATYQFSREDREALDALLTIAGLRRPVWRLSMEWHEGDYPLMLTRYRDGFMEPQCLAHCDPHGRSMVWRS